MTTPSAPPYDGRHLIADLDGCAAPLDDLALVEAALRAGVDAAGATLLKITLHHFGPGMGVTGVAILAESHISVHSWPEHQYAAIDIFLCGARHDLDAALSAIAAILRPKNIRQTVHVRGFGAALGD